MYLNSSTPEQKEGIFPDRGLQALNSLCLQRAPRTAQTVVKCGIKGIDTYSREGLSSVQCRLPSNLPVEKTTSDQGAAVV